MKARNFLERTTEALREAVESVAYAERTADAGGLLQRLDARVKLAGLLALVAATMMAARPEPILGVLAAGAALAVCSRISISTLALRVWAGAFGFTSVIALPAIVLTPGQVVARLPVLGWQITSQGIASAMYLLLRVETAATLGALLVLTTRWAHVLKALRSLHVPAVFVVVLGMTYRYILLLLESAHEMFEARRSRVVGSLSARDRRRLATSAAGVLLGKTMDLGNDVYLAMQARGFRGEVHLLDEFRMRRADWAALATCAVLVALALWTGR